MPGPPGSDDDQPILVIGGSLDVLVSSDDQNWVAVDDYTLVYSYSQLGTISNPGPKAKTRRVFVTVGSDDPVEVRNPGDGTMQVVLKMKRGSTLVDEVTFETDPTGNNLVMKTRTPWRAYLRIQKNLLRHPHKSRKVEVVVVIPQAPLIPVTKAVSGGDFSLVIQSAKNP